jgi:hypothetical protein
MRSNIFLLKIYVIRIESTGTYIRILKFVVQNKNVDDDQKDSITVYELQGLLVTAARDLQEPHKIFTPESQELLSRARLKLQEHLGIITLELHASLMIASPY